MTAVTEQTTNDQGGHGGRVGRDAYFDNAKFLLVALVVLGHGLRVLHGDRVADTVYYWIYFFHMPAFVVIAGYFSRSAATIDRKRARGLFERVLLPYLVFSFLYAGMLRLAGGRLDFSPLTPYWLLWFLMALAMWRLLTPYLLQLRHPMLLAVAVSLVAGAVDGLGRELSLNRVLSMLPFFVLGLVLRRHHFDVLSRRPVRLVGVAVLAAGVVIAWFTESSVRMSWLYWTKSYDDLGAGTVEGVAARSALLLLALVMGAAFFSLVPSRATWFTAMGAVSIYAYLLHGFVVLGFEHVAPPELVSSAGYLLLPLVSVLLTVVLCSAPVRRLTGPLVEPRAGWLLRGARA